MNITSKDIKERQKSHLRVIKPNNPRYSHEQSNRNITGRTKSRSPILGLMMKGSNAPYGEAKGLAVTGCGSFIEDPRGRSSKPRADSYMAKKAKSHRKGYKGSFLISGGQVNDQRVIESENVNKQKREWRNLLDRRENLTDVVNTPSARMNRNYTPLLAGTKDTLPVLDRINKPQSYLSEQTDFGHHYTAMESPEIKANAKARKALFVKNQLRTQISIDKNEDPSIAFNYRSNLNQTNHSNFKYYQETANETQNRNDYMPDIKNQQETRVINLMNLWDKAIEDYERAKVPLVRSIYLNENQRSLVLDLVKSGIPEDEVVNTIKNTNQLIRNQKINVNTSFVRTDVPFEDVVQNNIKLLNRRGPIDFRNYSYMTSEDSKIMNTQRDLFNDRATKVSHDDFMFTDVRPEYKNINDNLYTNYKPDIRSHLVPYREQAPMSKVATPREINDSVLRATGHVYMIPDKAPTVAPPLRTFHSNPSNRNAFKGTCRTRVL